MSVSSLHRESADSLIELNVEMVKGEEQGRDDSR